MGPREGSKAECLATEGDADPFNGFAIALHSLDVCDVAGLV